jgi:hypothetical protein
MRFENAETEELFLMMTRKTSVIIIRKYVDPAVEKGMTSLFNNCVLDNFTDNFQ